MRELGLHIDQDRLFTRCVLCNEILNTADKESVKGKVPEYVFVTQSIFTECPRCGKIYWKGTHSALADSFLKRVESRIL